MTPPRIGDCVSVERHESQDGHRVHVYVHSFICCYFFLTTLYHERIVRTLLAHSLWSFDRFYLLRWTHFFFLFIYLPSSSLAAFDESARGRLWCHTETWLIFIFFLCIQNRNFLCFIFISWFYFLYLEGKWGYLYVLVSRAQFFRVVFPMDSSGRVPRTYYNLHLSPPIFFLLSRTLCSVDKYITILVG